ncbi:hypothetical protein [Tenacibaculum sp. MAR_2009_124]|uniref:hypothetical protein n=1 Tax=Tenacibaculum sp. MAR_2009_124 TaxID=1250059 RepID=UPI00115FDBA8|nr:hypothetical protein [Tenacibaculum sp. MAR_2009_124]
MDKEKLLILLTNKEVNNSSFKGTLMMYLSRNIYNQKNNNLGVISTISDRREVEEDHLLKSRILLELNFFPVWNNAVLLQDKEEHCFRGKV